MMFSREWIKKTLDLLGNYYLSQEMPNTFLLEYALRKLLY